ncbi:acyl-CoA dehydratase activase [candidate division WOR-3 bacterium]|nr:acyl-CoA dehydratase activase [candidate division WOR-3 bacterium]
MYLGIDVGSVSTKVALIDEERKVISSLYLRTGGDPITAIKKALRLTGERLKNHGEIKGVGTTGSARQIAGILVKADVIKNEIIAHAIGTLNFIPEVRTIIDIGGQDSKIIILRDGIPIDFSMNTVCAAGTGSFLDHQADRLGIPIEEFGEYALRAETKVNIAGRCTVFAESDMVHKQQLGFSKEDIINGLCQAIVRNYLNNVAKSKEILAPIVFQGGVAANKGVVKAFYEELETKVIVPQYYDVMGAIGAAILAMEEVKETESKADFDFSVADIDFKTMSFECSECPNHCEIIEVSREARVVDRFGSRCGKWSAENAIESLLNV